MQQVAGDDGVGRVGLRLDARTARPRSGRPRSPRAGRARGGAARPQRPGYSFASCSSRSSEPSGQPASAAPTFALERVVLREERRRRSELAARIQRLALQQVARLGIRAEAQRERERRPAFARLRRGARLSASSRRSPVGRDDGDGDDGDRRDRDRADEERDTTLRGHRRTIASVAKAIVPKVMATYRELLAQVKTRDRRDLEHRGARAPRVVGRVALRRRPRAGRVGRGPHPRRDLHRSRPARAAHRGPRARQEPSARRLLLRRHPLGVRREGARGARLRERRQPRRRLHRLEAERLRGRRSRASLSPEQRSRYSRHLLIPEVGEEGQQRLLDARVLLIGAGGLGSPASLYLAAAGVGTLGIVDADVVDESNLQRQIVHSTDRLGEPKVESAKRTLEALNPDVRVVPVPGAAHVGERRPHPRRGWDVIVDGADNFPTRYLVNDASVWQRHPGRPRLDLPLRGPGHGVHARASARATAASSRSRRRPSWRRAAPRAACSACCRGSSARSRRTRRSS